MKKKNLLLTIFPSLVLSLFLTVGCSENIDTPNTSKDSTSLNNNNNNNEEVNPVSFSNMYNYSAVSGIHLLSGTNASPLLRKKAKLDENEKNTIISYLNIVQDMLSNNFIKSEENNSDRQGFEKMYTISSSYLGSQETYTFYYTETKINDNDDDDDFDWDNEENFSLNGLVIFEGQEYNMTGKKEKEDNEEEITFKILKDNQNYVVIEHSAEDNETSYEYSQYSNGRKVFESEMEYEYNKKTNRLEVEFEKETQGSKESYKYFYVERNNTQYVEVIHTVNNQKSTYYIRLEKDQTTGKVNYIFEE